MTTTICSPQSKAAGPNKRLPWLRYSREYHFNPPRCRISNLFSGEEEGEYTQNAAKAPTQPKGTSTGKSLVVYPWNMKKTGMRKQKNGPNKCQPDSAILEDAIRLTEQSVVHDFDDKVYVEAVVDLTRGVCWCLHL